MKKTIKTITALVVAIICIYINFKYIYIYNRPKENQNNKTTTQKIIFEEDKELSANLTFAGDLLYEKPYITAIEQGEDKSDLLSRVKKYFLFDDLSIANMETIISDGSIPTGDYYYTFSAPAYIGNEIINSGFDVLGTANNHSNDYGYDGIKSSINFYKNNSNILTVGTNILNEENYNSQIIEKNGIKFGFVGYTSTLNKQNLSGYSSALNFSTNYDKIKSDLEREINVIKPQVDCLIAIVHWGREFSFTPHESEVKIANILNELGVDIIMGSHAHSIQPIEWIESENKKTLVMYGMGNFTSCDTKLSRTTDTYRNAYQYGLLTQVKVSKINNKIVIKDVKAKPIISYFNKNKRNFSLIPFEEYDENLEKTHYMYNQGFNKEFIKSTFEKVIKEEFR